MTFPTPPARLAGTPTRRQGGTTILRRSTVESETGYSRSTIYLCISQGLWTRPISLGARAVGWPASDVYALNAARIAGQSDAQIRDLVTKLMAERQDVDLSLTCGAG
jgi:prophage regulatory protein